MNADVLLLLLPSTEYNFLSVFNLDGQNKLPNVTKKETTTWAIFLDKYSISKSEEVLEEFESMIAMSWFVTDMTTHRI